MLYFQAGESKSAIWKKVNWKFIFHKLDLTDNFQSFPKKIHFLQGLNKQFSALWSRVCCNGQLSICVCGTSSSAGPGGLSRHGGTVARPRVGVAQSWSLMQLFLVISNTANLPLFLFPCIWLCPTGNFHFGLFFSLAY